MFLFKSTTEDEDRRSPTVCVIHHANLRSYNLSLSACNTQSRESHEGCLSYTTHNPSKPITRCSSITPLQYQERAYNLHRSLSHSPNSRTNNNSRMFSPCSFPSPTSTLIGPQRHAVCRHSAIFVKLLPRHWLERLYARSEVQPITMKCLATLHVRHRVLVLRISGRSARRPFAFCQLVILMFRIEHKSCIQRRLQTP